MGLFRKSKNQEKVFAEDDDPIWSELRKFRETQKRKLMGEGGNANIDSENNVSSTIPPTSESTEVESRSPTSIPGIMETAHEYQCKHCELKFKESWNRCPKCGGDVQPLGLDKSEDIRKLYPEPQPAMVQGIGQGIPEKQVPSGASPSKEEKVKKVRKIKRIQPQKNGKTARQNGSSGKQASSQYPPHLRSKRKTQTMGTSSKSKTYSNSGSGIDAQDQREMDSLFNEDPILDDRNIKLKEAKLSPKRSWKNVAPIVDTSTPVHTPPPEVRSMLKDLMKSEVDPAGGKLINKCPDCGFTNPPGSWEFCMKCGFRF